MVVWRYSAVLRYECLYQARLAAALAEEDYDEAAEIDSQMTQVSTAESNASSAQDTKVLRAFISPGEERCVFLSENHLCPEAEVPFALSSPFSLRPARYT